MKHLDEMSFAEITNQSLESAVPVLVWYRLQPERAAISVEDANEIMYHHCDDPRPVPGTLSVATCDESRRLHQLLHTDLTESVVCSLHKEPLTFDDVETPRVLTCPSGHAWQATGYEGGPERYVPIASGE